MKSQPLSAAAGGVPDDRCIGDVQGAVGYLQSLPTHNGKVGVIGFCSGGRQTYLVACNIADFDAAVDCWGGGVTAKAADLTPANPVAPVRHDSQPRRPPARTLWQ